MPRLQTTDDNALPSRTLRWGVHELLSVPPLPEETPPEFSALWVLVCAKAVADEGHLSLCEMAQESAKYLLEHKACHA